MAHPAEKPKRAKYGVILRWARDLYDIWAAELSEMISPPPFHALSSEVRDAWIAVAEITEFGLEAGVERIRSGRR